MDWKEFVRSDIEAGGDVHTRLVALIASGVDREDILAELDRLRAEYREAGQEELDDATMEIMDCFYGWCAPQWRL